MKIGCHLHLQIMLISCCLCLCIWCVSIGMRVRVCNEREKNTAFNPIVFIIRVNKCYANYKYRNFFGFSHKRHSVWGFIAWAAVNPNEIICKRILCHHGIPNLSSHNRLFYCASVRLRWKSVANRQLVCVCVKCVLYTYMWITCA